MSISRQFITAGEAIFTIEEPNKVHHTFKAQMVEGDDRWPTSWFVRFLSGPDNESDYTYLGKLDSFTGQVTTTTKSAALKDCYKLRLLNRILARVWSDDHTAYESRGYKTHHEGRCGRCGRTLTVPESVESGFGPECVKHIFPI